MNSILKNLDIAFKAYFTFEMYRVKLWLKCESPQDLKANMKKLKITALILLPVLLINQIAGIILQVNTSSTPTAKAACLTIFILALIPMLYIFSV